MNSDSLHNIPLLERFKLKIHRALNIRYALILTYHSVVGIPLEFDIWTHLPVSLFEKHMEVVSKLATVVSLSELVKRVKSGCVKGHIIAITFDDGFKNNYTWAFPILKKYGFPATIFITTDYIDSHKLFWPERVSYQLMRTSQKKIKSTLFGKLSIGTPKQKQKVYRTIVNQLKKLTPVDLDNELEKIEALLGAEYLPDDPLFQELMPLTWKEIKNMENDGLITFGGHTASHPIMSHLDEKQAEIEILKCKHALDAHLQNKAESWAYPNGTKADFDIGHRRMLLAAGFTNGIMTAEPEYISGESDINELGRFGISCWTQTHELKKILSKRDHISNYRGFGKVTQIIKGAFDWGNHFFQI